MLSGIASGFASPPISVAAVSGLMLVTAASYPGPFFGLPVAAAGGGAIVAGLVCLVGLGGGRALARWQPESTMAVPGDVH